MKPLSIWLPLILIVSALLLSVANSGSVPSRKARPNQHKKETQEQSTSAKQRAPIPIVPLAMYERSQAALLEALSALHAEQEERAKENNASYEPWYAPSVLVQVGLLIIGAVYSCFAWKQWGAIERQADILTIQSRPWIASRLNAFGDLIFEGDGSVALHISCMLKNTGNSVAIKVFPHLKLFAYAPTGEFARQREFMDAQHTLADFAKTVDPPDRSFGIVLSPNEEKPINQTVRATVEEIEKAAGGLGAVWFAIMECVDYRFSFGSPDHHQTIQIYDLFRIQPPAGVMSVAFAIGKKVPSNELGWGISFLGENIAT